MNFADSFRATLCWVAITYLCISSLETVGQSRLNSLTVTNANGVEVLNLTGQGVTGSDHRLEISSDLGMNQWRTLLTVRATKPALQFLVTNTLVTVSKVQFYRLVVEGSNQPPAGMAWIPGGEFRMGSALGDDNAAPAHTVTLHSYYLDRFEVSKALWDNVRNWAIKGGYGIDQVGSGKASSHPITTISWFDMVKWCNARSEREGRSPAYFSDPGLTRIYRTGRQQPFVRWDTGYRLPTEAEWERGARGGATGHRFPWSDSDFINHKRANYTSVLNGAFDDNVTPGYHPAFAIGSRPFTSSVGSFPSNGFGLYDMAGNVWEWCWDEFALYPIQPQADPRGPEGNSSKVLRGGGWQFSANYCTVSGRDYGVPTNPNPSIGFRAAMSAQALFP